MEYRFTRKHYCFLFVIYVAFVGALESCLEEERLGLLSIKDYFLNNDDSNLRLADEALASWTDDPEADCCSWKGVRCNNATMVTRLSLNWTLPIRLESSQRLLNMSWFTPFKKLRHLDLSENEFTGCYQNYGFKSLKNLVTLDLSSNSFSGNIQPCLITLTSLRSLYLDGSFSGQRLLNMSWFTPLKELRLLNLRGNHFTGCYQNDDFEALKNLVTLDLSSNDFGGNVQPCLSSLTSLRSLYLGGSLSGNGNFSIAGQSVLNMSLFTPFKELLYLDLSGNGFTGCHLNYGFKALKNLVTLDLSLNDFGGNMQPCLSSLTSLRSLYLWDGFRDKGNFSIAEFGGLKKLKILDLSESAFSGKISHSFGNMTSLGLCELKNLHELYLSHNNLSGTIPPCLGNWTFLRFLDLSFNSIEGNISHIPIFNLKTLKFIDLRENLLEGLFSFYLIANFTNLEVLKLSNLEVQTQYSYDWLPTFQLKVLETHNCILESIPQFLTHQTELRLVDLSHNNLIGIFPNWLIENNKKLEFLILRNNSFTGQFHLSSNSSFVMVHIDISDNRLQGELQPDIGDLFSRVQTLNLSANAFEGRIPSSIGHMPELKYLDLSNNRFFGEIATTLVGLANFSMLESLAASNNKLHGQIPNSINMTFLSVLQLSENQITGNLSSWISHYLGLMYLDIRDNHITGEIPPSIGNLPLDVLNMAGNKLEGRIPSELARIDLSYLDLSSNSLSGPIPSCFDVSHLEYLNLEGNRLVGSIPETLVNSSTIVLLNLGNNLLSGQIPSSVGASSSLRVLLLGRNSLGGLIPNHLCQLNELSMVDLSRNMFSGSIPRCLGNISFGKLTLSDFAYPEFMGFNTDGRRLQLGELARIDYPNPNSYLYLDPDPDWSSMSGNVVQARFVTKTRSNVYKGSILDLMSGLDLSRNQLTGEIPAEFGSLSSIHALNLSHNQLTGLIPTTLAKLGEIESLDLSHNKLDGKIPSELIGLNFLSYFSVAYNNLSGRLPDMDRQFQTFDSKSYEGNPFLCGPPLASCIHDIPQLAPSNTDASEEKWYHIDPVSFIASFVAGYLVSLVTFALVLYINPGWRWRLFTFIENLIDECYFLVFYTVPKFFAALYR